ncbi:MAG: choice-of-anchor J domain-containing protein [Candidatus Limisoma sp.]
MQRNNFVKTVVLLLAVALPMLVRAEVVRHSDATTAEARAEQANFARVFPGAKPRTLFTGTGSTTAMFPRLTSEADGTIVYGSLIGGAGDDTQYGIYSFPAATASPVSAVAVNSKLNANGGGVLVDDKYYFINWFDTGFGGIYAYFYICDTEDWSIVTSNRVNLTSVATDLTYDPVTKKVYGCFLNDSMDGYVFGQMSIADGSVTPIADLVSPFFFVAANSAGEVYGVDGAGRLYTINKTNGALTLVGNTGIMPEYSQSATFDPATGKLYWAAINDTVDGLYQVDTATAATTLIGNFVMNEEFGGLFIFGQSAEAGAPAAVTDLNVTYDTATTGNMVVTFTLPTTTYDGTALSGELDYIISLNDVEYTLGTANAGEAISETIVNNTIGEFKVAVRARNAVGDGPTEKVRLWVGNDTPAAPQRLTATIDGSSIRLSWDAPTEGAHGGYLNPAALNYKVIRYPDAVVIADKLTATTYTDSPNLLSLSAFWYEVIAFSNNLEGGSATTDKLLIGEAFTLPYEETFDRASNFNLFTVIDANGDGLTWKLEDSGSAVCPYSNTQSMNDWLITPPIHITADNLYRIRFHAHSMSSGWPEKMRVAFGTGRTVADMTNELFGETIIQSLQSQLYEKTFTVDADADYYFGFQSVSDAQMYKLYLEDIAIEVAASVNAPAAVDDLTLTAGRNGEQSVAVEFTVPTTTIKGDALESVSKVTVRRGNSIVKAYSNQAAGTHISFVDNACESGMNEYTVFTTNAAGPSLETTKSVFVGEDLPGIPQNIVLREQDGKALLTWDAPTTGQNGGYIDPTQLTYHILNGVDQTTIVAMNVEGTSYSFDSGVTTGQESQKYIVFGVNAKGVGYGEASNIFVFGTPYPLPFKESFSDASIHYDTWGIDDDDPENSGIWEVLAYGSMPAASPQDLDGGLLSFVPMYADDEAYLYSGKIDLKSAVNPTLEFYYYYPNGSTNELIVEATTNGYEFNTLETIDMSALTGSSEWKKVSIPLAGLKPAEYMRLGLRAIGHDGLTSIHVDNIVVRDVLDYNLEATSITCPKRMTVGADYDITVRVTNVGTKAIGTGGFSVSLYRDGAKVGTLNGVTLLANSYRDYTFSQTPDGTFGDTAEYYAVVECNQDMNLTNNTTSTSTVEIRRQHLPTPKNLRAAVDGTKVNLSWTAPDVNETVAETDDFEDYASFIIDGVGSWTLADVDRQGTAYFSGTWQNRGAAQAFIVFNAPEIGADIDEYGYPSDWAAHSGEQCMISFIADTGTTDDWLISPQLSGKAQTVKLFVKGVASYTDNYEILISSETSATNRASFTALSGVGGTAPEEWTEIAFDVPEGTNFFAVRHTATTADGFALLVDDATFEAKLEAIPVLSGYNVYCDDIRINSDLVAATAYVDDLVTDVQTYNVTAVYTVGESKPSNTVSTADGGVNGIAGSEIAIYGNRGAIIVSGAQGSDVAVYTADGKAFYRGTADSKTTVYAPAGVYLVKVGKMAKKVIVK